MIRAVYQPSVPRLTVRGHAAFAPKGQDIVCAAASALLYALIGSLQQREDGAARAFTIRPGFADVAGNAADTADFALITGGLTQLAARYPAYIAVEIEGS